MIPEVLDKMETHERWLGRYGSLVQGNDKHSIYFC